MAMHNVTESSYHALEALAVTVCALSELAEVIPSDDRYASLVRVLAERLDSDMQAMRSQVYELWQFTPQVDDEQSEQ